MINIWKTIDFEVNNQPVRLDLFSATVAELRAYKNKARLIDAKLTRMGFGGSCPKQAEQALKVLADCDSADNVLYVIDGQRDLFGFLNVWCIVRDDNGTHTYWWSVPPDRELYNHFRLVFFGKEGPRAA